MKFSERIRAISEKKPVANPKITTSKPPVRENSIKEEKNSNR